MTVRSNTSAAPAPFDPATPVSKIGPRAQTGPRRPASRRWRALLSTLALGAGVALAVRYRAEVGAAVDHLQSLGWAVLWVIPVFVAWNHVAAVGWRVLIRVVTPRGLPTPSTLRLALVRLEAQAVNLVLPLASLSGEVLKSTLAAGDRAGLWRSASSVALDTAASIVAGLLFTLAGVGVGWRLLPHGALATTVAASAALAALTAALPFLVPRLARLACRRPATRLGRAVGALAESPAGLGSAFGRSVAWHLFERLLTVLEVLAIAWALGVPLGLGDALFVTAIATGAAMAGFFLPAQLGAAEGGLALAFAALGLPAAAGLSVALVRRGRQIACAALGLAALAIERPLEPRPTAGAARRQS